MRVRGLKLANYSHDSLKGGKWIMERDCKPKCSWKPENNYEESSRAVGN